MMNTALTYILIVVASYTGGVQTDTTSTVIDNYPTKARCEAHLSILKDKLTDAGYEITFAECKAEEVGA